MSKQTFFKIKLFFHKYLYCLDFGSKNLHTFTYVFNFRQFSFEFHLPQTFYFLVFLGSEAATRGVLCKKVFLEISQNSQEKTCARVSFLIKLQG